MVVDFAIDFLLVRPGRPRYPMFVHQATALLHASFRPRLATTPLRFANPSPPSGWIKDFHLKTVDHAQHTVDGSRGGAPGDKLREAIHRQGKAWVASSQALIAVTRKPITSYIARR